MFAFLLNVGVCGGEKYFSICLHAICPVKLRSFTWITCDRRFREPDLSQTAATDLLSWSVSAHVNTVH